MRTPNYCLTTTHVFVGGKYGGTCVLDQGTFICPIELRWIPKHVLENAEHKFFNEETHVFCYTKFGMTPIPRKIIEER